MTSTPTDTPHLWCGLLLRLVGLVLSWAHLSLWPQLPALAQSRGIQPAQKRLERVHRDFPPLRRFLFFPTVFHAFHRLHPRSFDLCLSVCTVVGGVAGLVVFVGGSWSWPALLVAWGMYLSLANVIQLIIYPWDYLLLELSFLCLFLPGPSSLFSGGWNTSASASFGFGLHALTALSGPVYPLVHFHLRWLLFRLMFGFGKMKFLGAKWRDCSYLSGFMINMPLPSPIGWAVNVACPLPILRMGLVAFFVSEIIVPFGFIWGSGWIRAMCALATVGLQVGIQATGNFGFFNVLAAILCLGCMDGDASLLHDFSWHQVVAVPVTHVLLGGIMLPLSCFYLIFNSWSTMSLVHWPSINLPETSVGKFLRIISPWHFLHAYGIFFSHSSPPMRFVPILEGTADDIEVDPATGQIVDTTGSSNKPRRQPKWEAYTWRFMTTSPKQRPKFVAPYHYRIDQSIFYDATGILPDTLMGTLSSGNPYDFLGARGTNLERIAQCLLLDQAAAASSSSGSNDGEREGPSPLESIFAHNPFPSPHRPVKALRLSLYLYTPTSFEEVRRTGQWWNVKYACNQAGGIMTRQGLLRSCVGPQTTKEALDVIRNATTTSGGKKTSTSSRSPSNVSKNQPTLSTLSRAFYRVPSPSLWHPDLYLWLRQTKLHIELRDELEKQIAQAAANETGGRGRASSLDLKRIIIVRRGEDGRIDDHQSNNEELYKRFWSDFLPPLRQLHRRIGATARCIKRIMERKQTSSPDGTKKNSARVDGCCSCPCLTCRFYNEWNRGEFRRDATATGETMRPVIDWSAEISALHNQMLHGSAPSSSSSSPSSSAVAATATAATFTPAELHHFRILSSRLSMIALERILHATTPSQLWHGPGPDESHFPAEEGLEAREEETLRKHWELNAACMKRCSAKGCAGTTLTSPSSSSATSSSSPNTHFPAPDLAANLGVLRAEEMVRVGSARSSCPHQETHLHLPSFFHLHLFINHAILSCESEEEFAEFILHPQKTLSLVSSFSVGSGLLYWGLFQPELLRFHSRKTRLMRCMTFAAQRVAGGVLPGFLEVLFDFLPWQYRGEWHVCSEKRCNGDHERSHNGGSSQHAEEEHEHEEVDPANDITAEHWPVTRRPQLWHETWSVDIQHMPNPVVDLTAGDRHAQAQSADGSKKRD